MVRVTVDGIDLELHDTTASVLDAVEAAGISLPALCNDPRLTPVGACRTCLVEIDGSSRSVASCTMPVVDGMIVRTDTAELQAVRSEVLAMLDRERARRDPSLVDDSHPYIHVDMNHCIRCFRCVRICDEVQGQLTWRIRNRGADTRIVHDGGDRLLESSCVSCGACVDTCPTDALVDRAVLEMGAPEAWTRTVCPYCGVGCELSVGTRYRRIVDARPVLDAPVSRGHLCVKGRYAHGYVHAEDRVLAPMIRASGNWQTVSWDEAIAHVARELRATIERHGPGAVGVLGSARATNEDNYVIQKFARVALGTNNVDCCARVCHAPSAAALGAMLGTGAATSSFDDIEHAATILVCGANPTENHPIVGARIKQAVRRGTQLVVIDPRAIELTDYADVHLTPRPGTNIALLNAIAHVLVDEDLVDHDFVARRVDGFDEFRSFVNDYSPECVSATCGVAAERIRRAARLYATGPSLSFHGLGVTEHRDGTAAVKCLVDLALLTGNIGRLGAGVNPLRGQNNVQGAAQMGCEPNRLTGMAPIDAARATFEAEWRAPIPAAPGLDAMEMLRAAAVGRLHALFVVGWDVLLTNPDTNRTRHALEEVDLVVVQDLFFNETARAVADVFLPACSTYERDGTFMNSERRIQRVRAALPPCGDSRPDWKITAEIAHALGWSDAFTYDSAETIWDEVRRVWPAVRGITYQRLDHSGLQWPCVDEGDPGTTVLHTSTFAALGPRAMLACIPFTATFDADDDAYPFVLTTGRSLFQFNAGTMTARTPNAALRLTDTVEMAPDDARKLGVTSGGRVHLTSRYGSITIPVTVTQRVRAGELFATFSDPAIAVNQLTGPHEDPETHTPEYKVTAVAVVPA